MSLKQLMFLHSLGLMPISSLFADSNTTSPENSATESTMELHCEDRVSNYSESQDCDGKDSIVSQDFQDPLISSSNFQFHLVANQGKSIAEDIASDEEKSRPVVKHEESFYIMDESLMTENSDEMLTDFSKLPMDIFAQLLEHSTPLNLDIPSVSPDSTDPVKCDINSVIPIQTLLKNDTLCYEPVKKKAKISCVQAEHLLQKNEVMKSEQKPMNMWQIKQELNSTPESSSSSKTASYVPLTPKTGIVHKATYEKSTPSTSTKSSSKLINKSNPRINKNNDKTSIATKSNHNKNTVKFVNEDNELVVCSLKQKIGVNYDNLASKKHPKLTVGLIRLENSKKKITDLKSNEFSCNKCLETFNNKAELTEHTRHSHRVKRRSRELRYPYCSCCGDAPSTSSSVCKASPAKDTNKKTDTRITDKSPDQMYLKYLQKGIKYIKCNKPLPQKIDPYQRLVVNFCNTCNHKFNSFDALMMHKKQYHFKELWSCVDKIFTPPVEKKEPKVEEADILEVKVEQQEDEKCGLTCHVCGFQVLTRCHLEFHMKSHMSPVIVVKVEKVKSETKAVTPLPEVKDISNGISVYNVETRNWLKFKSKLEYEKVLKRKINPNFIPRYVCRVCNKMYRMIHSFRNHAMNDHIERVSKEDILEMVFIPPELDCEPKGVFGKPAKTYTCKMCGFVVKSKQAMQTHMIKKHCDSDSE